MVPEIWSATDRIFLLSWTFFCPFTPLTAQKIKIYKKKKKKWKKKILQISSFYTRVPKIMIIGYTVPEIWHMRDVIVIFHFGQKFLIYGVRQNFLSFWAIFCPPPTFYPPISSKNENLKKIKNNSWRFHHFTQLYQKSWRYAILFLKYSTLQM